MSGAGTVELVVFCGLQASGKTTCYRRHFSRTHAHVSKDLMPNNRRKEARQRELIDELLGSGRCVVVDNTNPTVADRAPLIALGRRHGARVVAVFFPASVERCVARNAQREGRAHVPDVGIFATAKKLQPPTLSEGYDEVRIVAGEDPHG